MSVDRPEGDIETDVDKEGSRSGGSKLDAFRWAILRWWGGLFRTFFISSVGIVGYLWLDPKSIGDVPFASLTLNQVFSNLFAVLIVIGCFSWFFDFPEERDAKDSEYNPYVGWGRFGNWVVLIALIAGSVIYSYWLDQ